MGQNKNSAKIYTASQQGKLNVSLTDTKEIISVTNNKAKMSEEKALKYCNDAKKYCDQAKYYAEQNTNVTFKYINDIQTSLQDEINTKQPAGDYALTSQLTKKVSELENDARYVNETELDTFLPPREDGAGKFLKSTGSSMEWCSLNTFNLFDTKLSDHILEGEEAFGWALQGTYTLSSYTDFYQKCLEEKNAGIETQTTLGENTITTYNNPNGHIFFNIADKAAVDEFYNETGACWMYGIDEENERIFLPRKELYNESNKSSAPVYFANTTTADKSYGLSYPGLYVNGVKNSTGVNTALGKSVDGVIITSTYQMFPNSTILNAAALAAKADLSSIKSKAENYYLYICVGNTVINQADLDVQKLTGDIEQKADADLSNCTRPYLIETYVNGTSGYRVWSDRICEQWGQTTSNPAAVKITLLKPYRNSDYNITLAHGAPTTFTGTLATYYEQETKKPASFTLRTPGGSPSAVWHTIGEI